MGRSTNATKSYLMLATAAAAAFTMTALVTRPAPARAADDAKGTAFFEEKIRPILAQNCVGCHGEEKHKGDLRLDTRENLLKGGKDDNDKPLKVVELGNPDKSPLIEAVEYKNEDIQMPPPKKKVSQKLSDDKIAALKEWIKMGAPYGDKPVMAEKK